MTAPVGRPEKYETHVLPHLEIIKQWREQGMKLEAIAKQLNIAKSTLCEYQKEYSDLSDVLKTAKEKLHANMLITAEDSVLTLLKDREVTEITVDEFIDQEGNVTGLKKSTKTRVIPANSTAIIFTLKNRDPDHWKDRTELDANISHTIIPQPLAPVRPQDAIEGEVLDVESLEDEANNSVQ